MFFSNKYKVYIYDINQISKCENISIEERIIIIIVQYNYRHSTIFSFAFKRYYTDPPPPIY